MICKKCGGNRTEDKCNLCELFASGETLTGVSTTTWPMKSEALAVHASQVEQANDRNKRHGIAARYDKQGFCHIPDRADRKRLLKVEGFRDNSGGYGD